MPKNKVGVDVELVKTISADKGEPDWMLKLRLRALKKWSTQTRLNWGPSLAGLKLKKLTYYVKPLADKKRTWADVSPEIRRTFEVMGVPQAERKYLAGVGAQFDSGTVYQAYKKALQKSGVIFTDMETGVREYPALIKKYFGRLVPIGDNPFATLNAAVWSGGSFIYVPRGVKVDLPLQAYFRINARTFGQFERSLIIADTGSEVNYIEGCSAPTYSRASLHAAVVEVFVQPGARVRYTTVQNWSPDVYNLVTKRARVAAAGTMEWIDGNIGAGVTMKYPSCYLVGRRARGELRSVSMASAGQHQDTGARMIHLAPATTSVINSKSVVSARGHSTFRGGVKIMPRAKNSVATMKCDTLLLHSTARADSYPALDIRTKDAQATHEATVSKIDAAQLFYLQCRGLNEAQATGLMVNGFIEPIVAELPLEYAVELQRLINIGMETKVK